MLSAIAPRKDSAQSSKEGLKVVRDHRPLTTSPLASSSRPDVVTNAERTKSPELTRVLSPLRPRRTPKLVNAPEVRWRLAPHLQHMPSLDSVMSSETSSSEASTARQVPVAPHDVALPVTSASSIITTLPATDYQEAPLPPSSSPKTVARHSAPAQVGTRFDKAHTGERVIPALQVHQPHFLSPVIEATSAPSIRSSIVDLNVQDVGTAERRPLSDVRRQNVNVLGANQDNVANKQSPQSGAREQPSVDMEEQYDGSVRATDKTHVHGVSGSNEDTRKEGICGAIGKLRKSVKSAAGRVADYLARRYVARALAKML